MIKQVLKKVVGDAASKAVEKGAKLVERKIDLEEAKVNKELNIEKEKTKREEEKFKREHQQKMEELELSNGENQINIDYVLAATSVEYLNECINQLESQRYTYKYMNAHYSESIDPIDRQIKKIIGNYKIGKDREEYILACETFTELKRDEREIISEAAGNKWFLLKSKAKEYFPDDKEVVEALGLKFVSAKKKKTMIFLACVVGALAFAGIATGITCAVINENTIPPAGEGQTIYIQYGSSHFIGEDYLTVQAYFESMGFEDITLNPLGDLITGWVTKENTVDKVIINGEEMQRKQWYTPLDPVIINYHSF